MKIIAEISRLLKTSELFLSSSSLVQIKSDKLFLCSQDITCKLQPKIDRLEKKLDNNAFENFVKTLSGSFLRLNHLGINYWCDNIEDEVNFYKDLLIGTNFHLYEEKSNDPNARWLFIGDTTDWQSPLFEIILNDKYIPENEWRPHFQIDIDTDLKQEDLETKLEECFGPDFISWKLDIKDYGVVLEMGLLESMGGSKIYLGVGTNIRDTKYHREKAIVKLY